MRFEVHRGSDGLTSVVAIEDNGSKFDAFDAQIDAEKAELIAGIANKIAEATGYDYSEVVDHVIVWTSATPTAEMINQARVQAGLPPIDPAARDRVLGCGPDLNNEADPDPRVQKVVDDRDYYLGR